MAATIFREGESLAAMRAYLQPLGQIDAAAFLQQLADRYAKSADRAKQLQAQDLAALAKELREGGGPVEIPRVLTKANAPSTPTQAPTLVASAPTGASPPVGLIAGDGVRLRANPNQRAAAIALLKNRDKVEILDVVEGDRVEGQEKRWYKVRSGQAIGYIYYNLIESAE
jgi:hypothetical protein